MERSFGKFDDGSYNSTRSTFFLLSYPTLICCMMHVLLNKIEKKSKGYTIEMKDLGMVLLKEKKLSERVHN